ncbi:hypothetical protein ALC56_09689 [Trachymyrmex septentrionalis]|uniref:Uncharacterized protein n=1 Tax=Trachymyrmex septentrionalis TaxID=34720 RepID=A0A195F601_9HYME|nr:hypothetical protein ALC56_09689 [Trachymyrmex septentrionalis]
MSTVTAACPHDIKASLRDEVEVKDKKKGNERQQTGRNRRKEEAAIAPTKRRTEGLKRNRNDEEERKCQMQGWESIEREKTVEERKKRVDRRERREREREREREIGACKSTVKARNLNSLRFTMIAAQKSQSLPSRFARVIAVSVAITAFDNDVARRLFH